MWIYNYKAKWFSGVRYCMHTKCIQSNCYVVLKWTLLNSGVRIKAIKNVKSNVIFTKNLKMIKQRKSQKFTVSFVKMTALLSCLTLFDNDQFTFMTEMMTRWRINTLYNAFHPVLCYRSVYPYNGKRMNTGGAASTLLEYWKEWEQCYLTIFVSLNDKRHICIYNLTNITTVKKILVCPIHTKKYINMRR